MFYLLCELTAVFENRKIFEWSKKVKYNIPKLCGTKIYDFYIPSLKCIIETNGEQHYKKTYRGNRTYEEEVENDKLKEKIAKENGIVYYISINSSEKNMNFIKNNIMESKLNELFDLSNIDWLKCHESACSTLVRKACDLWNLGMRSTLEIGQILKIAGGTVLKYLKQGEKLGWIKYDKNEVMIYKSKKIASSLSIKIIQLTKDNVFVREWNSATEVENKLGIYRSNINHVLKGKLKSTGGFKWMYKEEYEKQLVNIK
jgi:hypothetical protein